VNISVDADSYIDEIGSVCDALLPRFENDGGGWVSVALTYLASSTINSIVTRARELHDKINRPNVIIGIIADTAGIEAIGMLSADGISVNALEIYSSIRAQQAAEQIIQNAQKGAVGIITVSVNPYDVYLNERLKQHGLAQNRIGFFVATKIYNLIEERDSDKVRVMFARLDKADPQVSDEYYIENLNLPNAYLLLGVSLFEHSLGHDYEESFHFQNKHLDAFFSFLSPAQISINEAEDILLERVISS
jgi:transaldolase